MRCHLPLGLLLSLSACSADPEVVNDASGFPPIADSSVGVGADAGPTGSDAGNDAGNVVTMTSDGGLTAGDLNGCVGTKTTAPPASDPKIDIVWVVDASGSMLDEQKRIGANLTKFAESITQANVDVTITMLTTGATIPVICPVVDPDPLQGTMLGSDPRYHFVETDVDSNNLLDVAVNNYASYASFLRPGSSVQFVFVTDDESEYKDLMTVDERATTFRNDMTALLGRGFTAHTIASEGPEACSDPNCMPDANTGICVFVMLGCGASAPGDTYYKLAAATAGVTASICQSDWTDIFQELQDGVIASAPLPCDYTIPAPPQGDSLDPSKVNVAYAPPGGAEGVLPKAKGGEDCGNDLGWYYDNDANPNKLLLCPAACAQASSGGTMNIAFGCSTVVLR